MYELSVFLHILSAMGWVGGMLFLALVVVPVGRRLPPGERAALLHAVGQRFRAVGWTFVTILVITGIINVSYRGVAWGSFFSAEFYATTFGRLLTLKLLVVAAMVALTALHDFVVGPATTRALARECPAAAPDLGRLRRRGAWLARTSLLLALVIVALAVMLVRGLPW